MLLGAIMLVTSGGAHRISDSTVTAVERHVASSEGSRQFLESLSEDDVAFWLPLSKSGHDARLSSRKNIERIPEASWECIFHPSARDNSPAFSAFWDSSTAPNISDPESPYYQALDPAFADWDGDENWLSVDRTEPHAQTKWTSFNRCFQLQGSDRCPACLRAIEAALLFHRAFVAKTIQESNPKFLPGDYWVVGAGPGGLVGAVELALMGHRVAVVERRYTPHGFDHARSTGIFRHTERLLSALGMPRYFTSNLFLYKHKRSLIFPSVQDYLKFVALKIGVTLLLDCETDVSPRRLLIKSVRGGTCQCLAAGTPSFPGRWEKSDDHLTVDLRSVKVIDSTGAGKPFTKALTKHRTFLGQRKDMTEVAHDLVCRRSEDQGPEDFLAQASVLRSQGARLEVHPNLARASVNSAFELARDNGDLAQAWTEFRRTLCEDVPHIQRLRRHAALENWDSRMAYPKDSFWYGMRADVKANYAFVFNIDRQPFSEPVWSDFRDDAYGAVQPKTSAGGGGKAMLQGMPNSIWIPTPNDADLSEDVLYDDTPALDKVGPQSWQRYHFEGTLLPSDMFGNGVLNSLLEVLMHKIFKPGHCSLVKAEQFLTEALSGLFEFGNGTQAADVRASFMSYFENNEREPEAPAMNAAIFPIGFEALPFGDPELGSVLSKPLTTDWQQELFIIGDAVVPAWFRFGIGIDDAKYGARAVAACSVLPKGKCEELILAHESELAKRSVQVYFNLWYSSKWMHRGGSPAGMRLNSMLMRLGRHAAAQFGRRGVTECPKVSEGFINPEDWTDEDSRSVDQMRPADLSGMPSLLEQVLQASQS